MEEQKVSVFPKRLPQLPAYVKNWAVLDLFFCLMQIFTLWIIWSSKDIMFGQQGMFTAALLVSGLLIFICGSWADIALLCRNRSGVQLAYVSIAGTVISIAAVAWNAIRGIINAVSWDKMIADILTNGSIAGARVIILFFYCLAIKKARDLFKAV